MSVLVFIGYYNDVSDPGEVFVQKLAGMPPEVGLFLIQFDKINLCNFHQ